MGLGYSRAIKHNCFPISIEAAPAAPETEIAPHRFVSYAGAYADGAVGALGVSRDVVKAGDMMVLDHLGVSKVEASVDFAGTETKIGSDAEGKAIPWASGPVYGYLYRGHVAKAGELISVVLLQNVE